VKRRCMAPEAEKQSFEKDEAVAEIQRRLTYLFGSDEHSAEEKEVIARRFFQALDAEEK